MSATVDPTSELPPWREPVRGGHPDPALIARPGVEQLRSLLSGATPRPPVSRLTGMRVGEVGHGTAEFSLPLTGWLASPQGAISIGLLTIPADAAMACAIQTVLPAATPFTTAELSLRLLRPARSGGIIVARGRLIEARRTIALAEVELRDEDGALIAHGSSLCNMVPPSGGLPSRGPRAPLPSVPADSGPARAVPTPDQTALGSPDPWQRPPQGESIDQSVWDRLTGLEVLQAQLRGELPLPPIHFLTGLTVRAAEPGRATVVLPASSWLCAPPPGRVQGGVVATLAETALSCAIQTRLPAGTALAPIDLKINFLRPLPADGREAVAHGRVVHAGRRVAVATSEVFNAEGKPVAIATGSAMLLPGRPASLGAAEI